MAPGFVLGEGEMQYPFKDGSIVADDGMRLTI